jgi:hypothetical protein
VHRQRGQQRDRLEHRRLAGQAIRLEQLAL